MIKLNYFTMKSFLFCTKKLFMFLVVMLVALVAYAQTEEPTPTEYLTQWTEAIFGAIVIIGGYLSNFIPGIKNINKAVYRVLAFAIVAGTLFVVFTPMSAVNAIIAYAISTSIYETVLSLFKRSPKPPAEIEAERRALNR
jgi:hypothetical protein